MSITVRKTLGCSAEMSHPCATIDVMVFWKDKPRLVYGVLLGLSLVHAAAGGALLPDLPKAAEPLVGRDWDQQEPERAPRPVVASRALVVSTNSPPVAYTGRFSAFGMDL